MSSDATDFLYPFIEGDETDAGALVADLARSAREKWAISAALRATVLAELGDAIAAAGLAMAQRFLAGGRLFTFGNGGSATDADAAARLFARRGGGRGVAARSLAADPAILTALANDIGTGVLFSRQVAAHAVSGDVALGLSTSGDSDNVVAALTEAHRRGLLTVGVAGYDGGRMAASSDVDHCLVVRADSVHRIQEAQAAVVRSLWEATRR